MLFAEMQQQVSNSLDVTGVIYVREGRAQMETIRTGFGGCKMFNSEGETYSLPDLD